MIDIIDTESARRVEAREAWPLLGFILFFYWLLNCGFDTSEGSYHYSVAEQMLTQGALGFDEPQEGVFTMAPNGRTYASHEIGNTVVQLPVAAVNIAMESVALRMGIANEQIRLLKEFVRSFLPAVFVGVSLLYTYKTLVEFLALSRIAAGIGVALLGFSTFLLPYSRNLFDGVLCMALLSAALYYLLRGRRSYQSVHFALAYCLLGFAVITRLSMVIPVVASLTIVSVPAARRRPWVLAVSLACLAPFAAWQMFYNNLRTGNLLKSPVQTEQYQANNAMDGSILEGVLGIVVSPGKSIFVFAPVLALSFLGWTKLYRRDQAIAIWIAFVAIFWLLLHAKLRSWYGAFGWGPRHFVTVTPVLALPAIVWLVDATRTRKARALTAMVIVAGLVINGAAIVGNWHARAMYRAEQGTLADAEFVWSVSSGQAIDMVTSAVNNFGVIAGIREPYHVEANSEINNFASNRSNLWWVTLGHAGVPWLALATVVIAMTMAMFACAARWWVLARGLDEEEAQPLYAR